MPQDRVPDELEPLSSHGSQARVGDRPEGWEIHPPVDEAYPTLPELQIRLPVPWQAPRPCGEGPARFPALQVSIGLIEEPTRFRVALLGFAEVLGRYQGRPRPGRWDHGSQERTDPLHGELGDRLDVHPFPRGQ